MALTPEMEELLGKIGDEKDREASRNLLEKYEPLRSGYLRQNDYDRLMNKTKEERDKEQADLKAAQEYAEAWKKWKEENEPRHLKMVQDWEKITRENDELKVKVETAARTASLTMEEGDVDANALLQKVNQELESRGYVPKTELPNLIREQASVLAKEEAQRIADEREQKFWKESWPVANKVNLDWVDVDMQHWRDCNEALKREELARFIQDNKLNPLDVKGAYDRFMSPKRTENEIKRRVDEQVKNELTKRQMPLTPPSAPEIGPAQLYITKKAPDVPEGAELGDGSLSRAAGAELAAEGKGW